MNKCLIFTALVVTVGGTPAFAQKTRDPHELMRLQRVLHAAMRTAAPSIVKVETFGGVRRTLDREIANPDSVAGGRAASPRDRVLPRLFPKLDREDFEELEKSGEWEPQDPDNPTWQDLRRVNEDLLKRMFDKHGIDPDIAPGSRPPGQKPKGLGPLVQPGFLQAQGATAGIILSEDGWILISRFALNFDPSTILVTLPDGRSLNAKRFGEDTSRGIALVKVDANELPVPEFVASSDVRVGQWAFALGRTFSGAGDLPTVHMGIVSATNRLFGRALQIDAYTSPANYGGPVVDLRGRVLGVSVPLSPSGRNAGVDWYDSGIGFATTLTELDALIARMKQGETLHRGWLGIGLDGSHLGPGAKLSSISKNSPALGVGLKKGDVIITVDDVDVKNSFHLQMLVSSKMSGDPVNLKYRRGEEQPVGVTVFLSEVPISERKAKTKKEETFTLPWEEGDPENDPDRGR